MPDSELRTSIQPNGYNNLDMQKRLNSQSMGLCPKLIKIAGAKKFKFVCIFEKTNYLALHQPNHRANHKFVF